MSAHAEHAAQWIYRGIWSVLVDLFRVPAERPTLPVKPGEFILSFQPDEGFLRYLKFWFWILLWPMDIAIVIAMTAIFIAVWWLGIILLIPALILAVLPDILAYIALHLKYDTTWYVMTDRSLRIRRGIWTIKETTITFENVQNLKVQQGPVQRHFGIANLTVDTAGGGGATGPHGEKTSAGHEGVIEGIANAHEVRDRILLRLRESKTAGLGDEHHGHALDSGVAGPGWTADHVAALREIRDEVRAMARS